MVATIAAAAVPSSSPAAPIAVTTCGQVVDGSAFLTTDLDCTGSAIPAVHLRPGASLDMRGFTIRGGDGDGVLCEDRCRVRSVEEGATISDFVGDGVIGRSLDSPYVSVTISRLAVRDNGGFGVRIDAPDGAVNVRRSEVTGNIAGGAFSTERLRVAASTISANRNDGLRGAHVQVRDSVVALNDTGVRASRYLKIDTCDIVDNLGDGINATAAFKSQRMVNQRNGGSGLVIDSIDGPAKVFFSEVSDNGLDGVAVTGAQANTLRLRFAFIRRNGGHGLVSRDFRLSVSRVDDNALHGVLAEPGAGECLVRIDRFSMIGNGTDPACGVSVPCADIASCSAPISLGAETVCGTSYNTFSGLPGTSWSICDAD